VRPRDPGSLYSPVPQTSCANDIQARNRLITAGDECKQTLHLGDYLVIIRLRRFVRKSTL
jgi:hypothetical protein